MTESTLIIIIKFELQYNCHPKRYYNNLSTHSKKLQYLMSKSPLRAVTSLLIRSHLKPRLSPCHLTPHSMPLKTYLLMMSSSSKNALTYSITIKEAAYHPKNSSTQSKPSASKHKPARFFKLLMPMQDQRSYSSRLSYKYLDSVRITIARSP